MESKYCPWCMDKNGKTRAAWAMAKQWKGVGERWLIFVWAIALN